MEFKKNDKPDFVLCLETLNILVYEQNLIYMRFFGRYMNKEELDDLIQDVVNYYDSSDLNEHFYFQTQYNDKGQLEYGIIGKTDEATNALKRYSDYLKGII